MTIIIQRQLSLFTLRFVCIWFFLADRILALITLGMVETSMGSWASGHFEHLCAHIQKRRPIVVSLLCKREQYEPQQGIQTEE